MRPRNWEYLALQWDQKCHQRNFRPNKYTARLTSQSGTLAESRWWIRERLSAKVGTDPQSPSHHHNRSARLPTNKLSQCIYLLVLWESERYSQCMTKLFRIKHQNIGDCGSLPSPKQSVETIKMADYNYMWLYSCRPKSVSTGLSCDLGWTTALWCISASEMTFIVSGGALNSTLLYPVCDAQHC